MFRSLLCFVAAGVASLTGAHVAQQPATSYEWRLPGSLPKPRVPADNPMTAAKADLGRYLFYDTRLSGNGTQSCATCHEQARAFTDARAVAVGSTQERHPRGSMSLVNVAYSAALTWANPTITQLEDQALVPMFGEHPIELGLKRPGDDMLARLASVPEYKRLFAAAFETAGAFTLEQVVKAIASFERTIISFRSPYDRYHYDRQDDAVSPAAKRGEQLFFSSPLSCFRCHNGFTFAGAVDFDGRRGEGGAPEFHNTGLYNLSGALSYPATNTGLYETTKRPGDVGKFKAPTLRNIAVTAPYMHDGSIATLEGVLDHYAAGGRTIADGPFRGVGHDNPNRSATVRGFVLTPEQRKDVIAFLESLTDEAVLHDPRFANPWTKP